MDRERLVDLLEGYVENELDEASVAELDQLLQSSAEARRLFWDYVHQHALTRKLVMANALAPRATEEVRPKTRRRASRTGGASSPNQGTWNILLIAAGVFFALIAIVTLFSGDQPPELVKKLKARPSHEAPPAPRVEQVRPTSDNRLREIEEKRRQLTQPQAPPTESAEDRQQRQKAIEDLDREKARIENELREAIKSAPKTESPTPEPAPRETTTVRKDSETVPAVARIDLVEGEAFRQTKDGPSPVRSGSDLLAGQDLHTGGGASRLAMSFPDKTRVELGADTTLDKVEIEKGKHFALAVGSLRAVVAKQPKDRPMVITTPHGEATVKGTTLRITVDRDPKKGTRLDVEEGQVEFKNLAGKTALVATGHYAVAATGVELVPVPTTPPSPAVALLEKTGKVTIKFGAKSPAFPDGVFLDSGEEFDASRGYGWKGAQKPVRAAPNKGEQYERMLSQFSSPDPLKTSGLSVGWSDIKETWRMPIPNGRYLITVTCGDSTWPQGPHHVSVKGRQVLDGVITQKGFVEKKDVPVEVTDGELTMVVGGGGKDFDGTSDTVLVSLVIRKASR